MKEGFCFVLVASLFALAGVAIANDSNLWYWLLLGVGTLLHEYLFEFKGNKPKKKGGEYDTV